MIGAYCPLNSAVETACSQTCLYMHDICCTAVYGSTARIHAVRVLIADSNREFLRAAARCVSRCSFMQVVGQATSAREALAQCNELHPDLVLIDLSLSDINSLEAVRQIKKNTNAPHVLIMSLYDVAEYATTVQTGAADGLILKTLFFSHFFPAAIALFNPPEARCGFQVHHARPCRKERQIVYDSTSDHSDCR